MIPTTHGTFDLEAIVKRFPDSSETMLIDTRLTDEPEASCRVFRIYREVPADHIGDGLTRAIFLGGDGCHPPIRGNSLGSFRPWRG